MRLVEFVRALAATAALAAAVAAAQTAPLPSGGAPQAHAGPPPPPPSEVRGTVKVKIPWKAASAVKGGNEALLAGDASAARKAYGEGQVLAPDIPEIGYDLGVAELLEGDLVAAERALSSVATSAGPERAGLAEDGRFNLGHVALQGQDATKAVGHWASVVAGNEQADDARQNLELALRLIQQQEKQQQQQQQEQQEKKESQDEKDPQQQDQDQKPDPQSPEQDEQPAGGQDEGQGQPEERAGQMSREQAERLLQMAEQEERKAMEAEQTKRRGKARSAPAGKDW